MAKLIGDEPRLARVYTYLVNYHYLKGEPDAAIAYGERCLAIGEASLMAGRVPFAPSRNALSEPRRGESKGNRFGHIAFPQL